MKNHNHVISDSKIRIKINEIYRLQTAVAHQNKQILVLLLIIHIILGVYFVLIISYIKETQEKINK